MILVEFLVKHCFQITLINLVVLKVEEWLIYNISTITSSILIINLTTCVPKNICCVFYIKVWGFKLIFFSRVICHHCNQCQIRIFFLYIVWLWLLLLYWWVIDSFSKVIGTMFLHPKNLVSTCSYNHRAKYLCRPISVDNRIIPSQVTCHTCIMHHANS